MVELDDQVSNQIFETLADWNNQLEAHDLDQDKFFEPSDPPAR